LAVVVAGTVVAIGEFSVSFSILLASSVGLPGGGVIFI